MTRRRIVTCATGLALVPEDPPLLPGDVLIDLSGLVEDRVPATHNRIDEVALEALMSGVRP